MPSACRRLELKPQDVEGFMFRPEFSLLCRRRIFQRLVCHRDAFRMVNASLLLQDEQIAATVAEKILTTHQIRMPQQQ